MKRTIRVLDLFCGAGGAARGYYDAFTEAGFEVDITGVDIKPQPRYPFAMRVGDAMTWPLGGYDFIHASPPCQHYSLFARNLGRADNHPDLVAATRVRLQKAHTPFIIENVIGAPLLNPAMLCGGSFGLRLARHRLFESTHMLFGTPCQHERRNIVCVYGSGTPQWYRDIHKCNATLQDRKDAMGIDWMTLEELSQAIPPAYTHWLGLQIARVLEGALA